MIKFNELKNKYNEDEICTGFEYFIKFEQEKKPLKAIFSKISKDNEYPIWNMTVYLRRGRYTDTQVYMFDYQIPKLRPDLTLVAATGLKHFQMYLKKEIQAKMDIDFALGEIIEGIVG